MSNNTYYIFRHGDTFSTRDGVPYGDLEEVTEILPEAVPAIKRIGEHLKTVHSDYFYTSPLLRCLQTSQIVSQITGVEVEKHNLLIEKSEPKFEDFAKRVQKLVEEMEKEKGKTFFLCTHGAVISALKHLLIFGKYEHKDLMDFPIPGTLMIINSSGSEILDFN